MDEVNEVSVREASQLTNIPYQTLYRRVVNGTIPSRKIGIMYILKMEDVASAKASYTPGKRGKAFKSNIRAL